MPDLSPLSWLGGVPHYRRQKKVKGSLILTSPLEDLDRVGYASSSRAAAVTWGCREKNSRAFARPVKMGVTEPELPSGPPFAWSRLFLCNKQGFLSLKFFRCWISIRIYHCSTFCYRGLQQMEEGPGKLVQGGRSIDRARKLRRRFAPSWPGPKTPRRP